LTKQYKAIGHSIATDRLGTLEQAIFEDRQLSSVMHNS